jgi:hypothetical protein
MATHIKRPFTDNYLSEYSRVHLNYEVEMFFATAVLYSAQPDAAKGTPAAVWRRLARNALLESFAVHTRNLVAFLYEGSPKDVDVVAADFCLPGGWKAIRPRKSQSVRVADDRASKEIAHLTTARMAGNPPEKDWHFDRLTREILRLLKIFADNALTTRLSPKVKATILALSVKGGPRNSGMAGPP